METLILPRKHGGVVRLVGTGRDPQRRIAEGEIALMRRGHPLFRELTAKGYAQEVTGAVSWSPPGR
ncbi:MAG: hypothetical protein R2725_12355 [Solirubrobacterales bacterium]